MVNCTNEMITGRVVALVFKGAARLNKRRYLLMMQLMVFGWTPVSIGQKQKRITKRGKKY